MHGAAAAAAAAAWVLLSGQQQGRRRIVKRFSYAGYPSEKLPGEYIHIHLPASLHPPRLPPDSG